MKFLKDFLLDALAFFFALSLCYCYYLEEEDAQEWQSHSLLTTAGMASPNASSSTIWSGWSFCNQAQQPPAYFHLGEASPRLARCPRVTQEDNALTYPQPIPGTPLPKNADEYARAKEVYLSHLCEDSAWAVMFKSGNFDHKTANLCPKTTYSLPTSPLDDLPMNQPLMVQGAFYLAGTYDVDPSWSKLQLQQVQQALHTYTQAWVQYKENHKPKPRPPALLQNSSFLSTTWYRDDQRGLIFSSMIQTSAKYPWLMNYLRANDHVASQNPIGYGGYPWKGAGNLQGPVATQPGYDLIMAVRLQLLERSGDWNGNFYMPEISGCWKRSDGSPCDPGDDNLEDNLTRYLCFSVTPVTTSACQASRPQACPPWHYSVQHQEWISATNSTHYPYDCYHLYCGPYSKHGCDPYSNPIPQELLQLKTCEEWGHYGFPTQPLTPQDDKVWQLNVGALGNHIYFYDDKYNNGKQAPTLRQHRQWISFEVGPEVGLGRPKAPSTTRWQVSHWDVRLEKQKEQHQQ